MTVFGRPHFAAVMAAALVALLLSGCAGGARPVQRERDRPYELVLLHTNDHHGTILPIGGRGGFAERATFVRSVREAHPNVLLLDAGDINTGTALSNMFEGDLDIRAYNLMGYDAVAFGNHEFSWGHERLERHMDMAEFPFVSSNIRTGAGRFLGGNRYLVRDFEGFRVGIIGITTLRTKVIANPYTGLIFDPEIEAARAAVELLRDRERADIVIALVHMGDVRESPDHVTSIDLAAAVPGIDVIVDGHSHTLFAEPRLEGGTYIVSAGERGRHVGKGILTVVNGRLAGFDWGPVEINNPPERTFEPDAEMAAMLAPYLARAEAGLREVVGEASDTFVFGNRLTRYRETAIGNMIADANVWFFREQGHELDFAFHNGGNIRAELPRGPITREDILTVLPFENNLYIVSLTGAEVLELFDFIATVPQGSGAFPQFSREVRYTLDIPARTVRDLTIGGAPVDPDRVYRFSTNDFLLNGGDGYAVLTAAGDRFNSSLLLSYVVIEYIASRDGVITPGTDGRITVVGGISP